MASGSFFVSKTVNAEQNSAIEPKKSAIGTQKSAIGTQNSAIDTQNSAIEISSQYESVQGLARRMRTDRAAVEHIDTVV